MAGSTQTTLAFILKKRYSDRKMENLAHRERTLLARTKKRRVFTGKDFTVPVQYGNPQSVSNTFARAQANAALSAGSSKGIQWVLTRAKKYGVVTMDAELLGASEDDPGAFTKAFTQEMDSTLDEMGHRAGIDIYGDGSGAIGNVSIAGATITLTKADDTKNFMKDQVIVGAAFANKVTGGLRAGSVTVTGVNEDLATITTTGTITGLAATDWLYNDGDYANALMGLAGWNPRVGPVGGDNFFGVDRSVDVARLSGGRITGSGNSIEESCILAGAKLKRQGHRARSIYLNPMRWADLVRNMGTKTMREQGGTGVMGFEFVELATPGGRAQVFADPECPSDAGYAVDDESVEILYMKEGFPHVVKDDGLNSIRMSAEDGLELRTRYFGQFVCYAPGGLCMFDIT